MSHFLFLILILLFALRFYLLMLSDGSRFFSAFCFLDVGRWFVLLARGFLTFWKFAFVWLCWGFRGWDAQGFIWFLPLIRLGMRFPGFWFVWFLVVIPFFIVWSVLFGMLTFWNLLSFFLYRAKGWLFRQKATRFQLFF